MEIAREREREKYIYAIKKERGRERESNEFFFFYSPTHFDSSKYIYMKIKCIKNVMIGSCHCAA
jgi:hypothetical protein